MLNADLKHCQQVDGPYLIATTLGAPIFGASFAPKVGIRALREPSPLNSPYFAEPNRHHYLNNGRNIFHVAGCLTLKNKINSFFPYVTEKLHLHRLPRQLHPPNARTFLEPKTRHPRSPL